ncbi:MAG: universal stress protein [Chloroflexota bacterium]
MFKRILVPLDGSHRAEQALEIVKFLNAEEEIELILLEVIDPVVQAPMSYPLSEVPFSQIDPAISYERADGYLTNLLGNPTGSLNNRRAILEYGTADQVIIETAKREAVDLIVMVTHGYKGVDRFILGSVTEKVIRGANCPVLALRDGAIPSRFLVTLDCTPFSESILAPSIEFAQTVGAKVTLAHICKNQNQASVSELHYLATLDPGLYDRIRTAQTMSTNFYLDDLTDEIEEKTGISITYELGDGPTCNEILAMADRQGHDLIVMKTHGRTGLERLLKGSVTEQVFREGKASMLIFHTEHTEG